MIRVKAVGGKGGEWFCGSGKKSARANLREFTSEKKQTKQLINDEGEGGRTSEMAGWVADEVTD